jgi:hypothetical protein
MARLPEVPNDNESGVRLALAHGLLSRGKRGNAL